MKYLIILSIFIASCQPDPSSRNVYLDNAKLRLGFDRLTGQLTVFEDCVNSISYLDSNAIKRLPWEIILFESADTSLVKLTHPSVFSFTKSGPNTLQMIWKKFQETRGQNFQIVATVSLQGDKPFSFWKISVEGLDGNYIHKLSFPIVHGLKEHDSERLAVPFWMGQEIRNPREHLSIIPGNTKKYTWDYPGQLSAQCLYLYHPDQYGFYAACQDSLAFVKSFEVSLDTLNSLTFLINHFPALDSTRSDYVMPYEAVVGSFRGDWIDAAQVYGKWATQQKWCRESRFKNRQNPSWLDSTALWVWNRGRSGQVLGPAMDLQQKLGLPVSVFWHWWHGCAYDVGFPEYFPPREGKDSFVSALTAARENGVRSIIYMNVLQWGTSTRSWEKENAARYAVRNLDGSLRSHVYNIFTGKSLTNMCIVTAFWKKKYASLSHQALMDYGVDGIYMDQACLSRICYDPHHGHKTGGGNYWVKNFGELTRKIRQSVGTGQPPLLAGEGGGEAWIPYLNAFLTLQVSKERYAGPGDWETIPFFQAVYHPYAVTFGNYSSLLTPPYDEKWPEEFAPTYPLSLLDQKYNRQFLIEQARSFVWGMQPTLANYQPFLTSDRKEEMDYLFALARVRHQGLKYLLYGKFLRSPPMDFQEAELPISKLSIYAGRGQDRITSYNHSYPLLYAGTWQSEDLQIGIAMASISHDPYPVNIRLKAHDYDLPERGNLYLIDEDGKHWLDSYQNGIVTIEHDFPPKGIGIFEITP